MNHLQIRKVCLVVGLDTKFFLLMRKLKFFKTRIKVKPLTSEKGFRTVVAIWLFTWLSVNHDWVTKYKTVARKVSKVYPKNFNVYLELFHRHLNSKGHNGMNDWKIKIINRVENVLELRSGESCWQHRLGKFILKELMNVL